MFHFYVAELVKVGLPATPLSKIVRNAFTHEDVTGIPAIHHPLRDVDTDSGNVVALVRVLHLMDGAAMDSHPYRQTRLRAQSLANLQGAFDRLFH